MLATKSPRGGREKGGRTNHDPVVREELVGLGEELSSLDDGVCRRVGQRVRVRIRIERFEEEGEDEPGRPVPTVRASCSSVQKKGWNSKLVGRIPEGRRDECQTKRRCGRGRSKRGRTNGGTGAKRSWRWRARARARA